MSNSSVRAALLAPVVALALAAPAAAESPWIHVRVEETHGDRVAVNLPLGVVKAALALAPEKISDGRHIHVGDHGDLEIADIKRLWAELRDSAEGELVSVTNEREQVRVAREGDRVLVRIEGDEKVAVEVPVALVDALLAPEGDALDLAGALEHLEGLRGDIVTVQSEDGDNVRVWVDESAGPDGSEG